MGWLTFNKPSHISASDYFLKEYSWGDNHELLDIAIVNLRTAYMALRIKNENRVIAFVYLLHYSKTGWDNFGYKDMSEFCGPNEASCPERIMKLLTPLNEIEIGGFADEWRKRCIAKIEIRKKQIKFKEGIIIKTKDPVLFNISTAQYFKREGKRWKPLIEIDGELVRLNWYARFNPRNFQPEIVTGIKERV